MRTRKSQRGVSTLTILLLVIIIAFASTIGIRLFPTYMDYYSVRSTLNEVAHSPGIGSKGYGQVWDLINNRLMVNNINNVSIKDFNMNTVGNETTLTIKYQVKKHLIANIDGLIKFDYSVHYARTGG